jgi:hypothetical protein
MSDFPMVDVVKVKALPGHRLWLAFSDGSEGVADLSADIGSGGEMVEALRDEAEFERVFAEDGVPTWPNGFDVDAITLYLELKDAGLLKRSDAAE